MLLASVRAGEEGVLPIQGQGPDRALDDVGVDLDALIIEEGGSRAGLTTKWIRSYLAVTY